MARDADIPELLQDMVFAERHGLMQDRVGRALMRVIRSGASNQFCIEQLQSRVQREKERQFASGAFQTPRLRSGEIMLGADATGGDAPIDLQTLNAHVLTVAGSGSGKTNRSQVVALQVAPHVAGMWLCDCRKAEFIKLKKLLDRLGLRLCVISPRILRFNPLQVPAFVLPLEWASRVADMLVMVMDLPPRASKLLQITIHRLYREAGVLDGGSLYPTLYDLLVAVREDKQLNAPARSAILDNLESLLSSLGPEVLAWRRGWTTHDLSQLLINFVLGGVPEVAQNLILNWLLLSEFTSRLARGVSNVPLDLYISIDEGQRLLSTTGSQNNALAAIWPLVRGTGIGVDVSVPSGHGLMPAAMSFTATKFLGRCGSAADYELVGRSMGLNQEQLAWVFHHTKPGVFVAQLGDGDWRHPFVLNVPELRLPSTPMEEDVGPLAHVELVPATEHLPGQVTSGTSMGRPALHDRAYRLLKVIVAQPLQRSSHYPPLAGMGPKTAIAVRAELIAMTFIRERTVDSGGRGRSSILLEPTPEGIAALTQYEAGALP